ncbi:MAG: CvpA family protein [Rhodospirillales bacterium]|nr:CvpA family protein [Rhodospirillales bacterium]
MDSLPINILDLGLIVVILLSALIGLSSGFIKSGLYIVSWAAAGFATLYGFPIVRPYGRQYIETEWMADLTSGIAIFVLALTVFTLLGSFIGSWVRNSRLNALDRSLGMLAGIAIGFVVVFGAYAIFEKMVPPEKQPLWAQEARALPILQQGSATISALIPGDAADTGFKAAKDAQSKANEVIDAQQVLKKFLKPSPQAKGEDRPDGSYNSRERQDMERLIDGSR